MARQNSGQRTSFIAVLLDRNARDVDRDDAAMALAHFDGPEAAGALLRVASDPTSDPELTDTCGEALAAIWLRAQKMDVADLRQLTWPALHILVPTILLARRDWASEVKEALRERNDVDWEELGKTVGNWFTST